MNVPDTLLTRTFHYSKDMTTVGHEDVYCRDSLPGITYPGPVSDILLETVSWGLETTETQGRKTDEGRLHPFQ